MEKNALMLMVNHETGEEEFELCRLKELVPSVSVKENVTQLDVILEAIRYIASLRSQLERRKEEEEMMLNEVGGERIENKANQKKSTTALPQSPLHD